MAFIIEHKRTRSVHSHSLPLNQVTLCATYSTLWSTSIRSSAMFPIKAKLENEDHGKGPLFATASFTQKAFAQTRVTSDATRRHKV